MAVSAEEVNFLVYRYLQESGHLHSAFTFAYESLVTKSTIATMHASHVPPGALISFIQKGLMYLELGLQRSSLISYPNRPKDGTPACQPRNQLTQVSIPLFSMYRVLGSELKGETLIPNESQVLESSELSIDEPQTNTSVLPSRMISSNDVVILAGHEAEVFCCSWHPHDELLASGSGDSTVRLWDFPGGKTAACLNALPPQAKVTTLEWSTDGNLLATGCMDGIARLWSRDGILQHSLAAHSESIFSLRFDAVGKRLLTGSYDKCVSVWDVATGKLQHKFEAHSAQVLDVDWKHGGYHGRDVFASCSTDRTIAVCALADDNAVAGSPATTTTPLQVLVGHADEVNAIRWDPSGSLLASCSDDHNVLIWQLGHNHTEEIYTIRWSPTGPTTALPNAPCRLASASFDATVRLWDTEIGVCSHTLRNHTKKVYTIAFSPNGDLLASGSLGGQLNIWSVKTGILVRTFNQGSADIFEVAWNANGTRLAATSTNAVTIIDVRN
ncbi:hypothetical protein AURANDRAFT_59550 [Aureococcus anophagefferens]|uniref:Uncharacterized protein n=1 Tax=Aureococcus anophagefferens TaxID=44056 RepID=F0YLG7_AURAN|nr:hypothetical protein AURANDRAFT_59550 [Aureococcus anophagefferens]EGB04045.1 hypothetical protein AURANDRAFT_59550 [Aureococcus anophagefferens]|eukprot:XP_009041322.1 hypothetical protein AURANDRAFT_59550 [Aureococcus anophagefferens]